MEDCEDGSVLVAGQVPHEREDLQDVADVEMGGRLVQEQHRSLLGQRLGQDDALSFASRQLVHRAVGQMLHVRGGHGPPGLSPVLGPPSSPSGQMRGASHQDHFEDRVGESGGHFLGNHGNQSSRTLRRDPIGVNARHPDHARPRREPAGRHPDQRGLPRPVGTDQPGHLTGPRLQVDPVQDRRRTVSGGHPVQDQAGARSLRAGWSAIMPAHRRPSVLVATDRGRRDHRAPP